MRSSKQRSRSKQNRNRSVGNVVNRVFDSSGPEGKVRGTPQQIIDKYNQLARDAQLSGDRVATENFQQHAEHYTRMLAEAMREQEARREAQESQNRDRHQPARQQQRDDRDSGQQQPQQQPQEEASQPSIVVDQAAAPQPDLAETAVNGPGKQKSSDVIDVNEDAASGLVETPESKPARKSAAKSETDGEAKPAPKPRTRRPRKKPTPAPDAGPAEAAE